MSSKNETGIASLSEDLIARMMISASSDTPPAAGSLECPETVEISDLIAGNLANTEKRKLWEHLGSCDDCRQVFVSSMETMEELSKFSLERETKFSLIELKEKFLSFKNIFWTLPAVAICIFILSLINLRRSYLDLETDVARLLKSPNIQEFSASIKVSDSKARSLGFSGETSAEQTAFNLGSVLVDLEMCLAVRDYEQASIYMDAFIRGLKLLRSPELLIDKYQTVKRGFGEDRTATDGLFTPALKNFLEEKDLLFLARFGHWLKAGEIAATMREAEFYSPDVPEYFEERSVEHDLPKGVRLKLKRIKNIVQNKNLKDSDFQELSALFNKILFLLGRD